MERPPPFCPAHAWPLLCVERSVRTVTGTDTTITAEHAKHADAPFISAGSDTLRSSLKAMSACPDAIYSRSATMYVCSDGIFGPAGTSRARSTAMYACSDTILMV